MRGFLAVLIVAAFLAGCTPAYVRTGDSCSSAGAEAHTKTGLLVICKEPSKSDPTGKNRWRRP